MFETAPSVAEAFSRVVRRLAMIVLTTCVFGALTLYLVSTMMFGVSRHTKDLTVSTAECGAVKASCPTMADELLARAVTAQERGGRTCTDQPSRTDVVLFQYSSDQHVAILAFAEALEASGERLGWVRRYCR